MKIERYNNKRLYRNVCAFGCQVSIAVLLTACGNGSSSDQTNSETALGVASVSAAQLADGNTTSLSVAQAAAAGYVPVPAVQSSTDSDAIVNTGVSGGIPTTTPANQSTPVAGAALPGGEAPVPTNNTNNSDVAASTIPATTASTTPAPTTDAAITSEPVTAANQEPIAEQAAEPAQQPTSVPEPAAVATPTPAPATDSAPEPAAESTPEPAAESTPEPAAESTPAPAAESTPAPATESTPEPAAESTPAPAAESTPAPTPAPAAANNADNESDAAQTSFSASNTPEFNGEVLNDGVVKVTWKKDPTARGYNVYRQAEYVKTVWTEEFIDKDTFDESYYYEIQAFDNDENYNRIATGLTVEVTGTGRTNPDSPKPKENILDGYELVFADEFNDSQLDTSKWSTSYIWGDELVINSEEQHYVDIKNKPNFGYNPFTFDGESITINSIRTPDELKSKAFGQDYLSGLLTSYDSFKFTYGYVEARVQLPFGQGLWPAFWLLNAYYVDDKPEIDIMEFIGDNQDVVYHTYHYYDSNGELRSSESDGTKGIDFTNGWHTFAIEWSPGTLIYYVNGIESRRIVDSKVSQQEMYILANTALGGWWPGSPDSSTPFPAQYKIDYIRAYQKAGGPPQSDPTQGQESQLLLWDDVPNASPSHLPPFELWPQGYPEKRVY